ncbi:hypothetical protein LCGC14_2191930, partial [marine sediment metagenome]
NMDVADSRVIRKLADEYGITCEAMLVGCINKGINVICKQITDNEARAKTKSDEHQQG